MFGQTYNHQDLGVIAVLILLEGVLSIDNALVLALLAKRLSKEQQSKALTYGLVGAFLFRLIAVGFAAYLLQWRIVKLIGGGYLLWIAVHHFIAAHKKKSQPILDDETEIENQPPWQFWRTVMQIELTDVAFAVDSILAAIALVGSAPPGHVGPHPKLWVVITGGILGIILVRIAATIFIGLLGRFPRFESSAYLLVLVIGAKLLADWAFNSPEDPHRVDFHDPGSPLFWAFWSLMAICIAIGFLPAKKAKAIG